MTDQLDILALVAARLEAVGIAYMVTGSMAAGYYGQPRMTGDVDLDWGYLEAWAATLGLTAALERLRS